MDTGVNGTSWQGYLKEEGKRSMVDRLIKDPMTFFPMTRENVRENFPMAMRQFFSCDINALSTYKQIVKQTYTPDAVFDYPLAQLRGRDQILSFWTYFLLARKSQLLDSYHLDMDATWDPVKLQLVLVIEAQQCFDWLRWLNRLLKPACAERVFSIQMFKFVDYPSDGPGALRVAYHEEWVDQITFFGLIPVGVYALHTNPGTSLHFVLTKLRQLSAVWLHLFTQLLQLGLASVGLLKME